MGDLSPLLWDFLNAHKVLALVDMMVNQHWLTLDNPLRFSDGFSLLFGGVVLTVAGSDNLGMLGLAVVRSPDYV